ncbi:MAG: hypothetical protein JWO02_4144, partial [Solirubrobacterales bacterium]|nr:hypothetical protein [Solirubrobacterales bacterium]
MVLQVIPSVLAVIERGAQLPGEGQLPLAPVLHADHTAALAFVIAIYAGFAGALVWAAAKLVRERETLPLVLVLAGVVAANMEPIGDHVGLIVYAPDIPWFDYWVMGRQMPSFILVGEASYIALGSYYAYRMLERGRSLREIGFISAVLVGIPEILVEVGWHHWGMISYYGENPTRIFGIPLYSIVQNSTLLPVLGVVTFMGARHLRGARRLWLVLALPAATIGYIVGVSWPVYEAIQSSASAPVVWLAALVTCVASVGASFVVLQLPELRDLRAAREGGAVPAGGA